MNFSRIRTIARKDFREISKNRMVLVPIFIVPLFFVLFIPLLTILLPQVIPASAAQLNTPSMQLLMQHLPPFLTQSMKGMEPLQRLIFISSGYLFAPLFLMLPLMAACTIGADSFAGEKERKTMEALFYTPATDAELFIGKALSAIIPALLISWLSFLMYAVVVNAASWPLFKRIWFPLLPWWPLMVWVVPAIALMGIAATILVSAKVSTFMEAYQTSGMLVLLIIGILAGQATGVLALSFLNALLVGAFFWILDLLLIRFAIRSFSRSEMMTRL